MCSWSRYVLCVLTLCAGLMASEPSFAQGLYKLTVNSGTGGGNYPQGTIVSISPNAAPAAKDFLMWTGSTAYVANVTNPSITLTMPAASVTLTALYANAPDYIKISPNRRNLYQGGKPLLVLADTGWFILGKLGLAKFNSYVNTRAGQGFTAIISTWLPQSPIAPSSAVPVTPFTPIDDLRYPNAAYWNNAKAACAYAKAKGITLFVTGSYIGPRADDWGAALNARTNAELVAYGQFLGNTFREYDNVVWISGGDCLPTREGADRIIRHIKDGLESVNVPQLITAHLPSPYSTGQYYHNEDWLDINIGNDQRCYGTGGYTLTLADYQRFPTKPVYFNEPSYEGRGTIEPDTYSLLTARRGIYWGLFSGSLGAAYGHMSVYGHASPLNTNTAKYMVGTYLRKLMLDNKWHTWQPDVDGTVLTGGGLDLEWCSKVHDGVGSFAMAYMPCKETIKPAVLFVPKPVTAKMSWFQGPVNVKWMKPDTGIYTDMGMFPNTGSLVFTPPAVGDWVLLLKVSNPVAQPDAIPPSVPQIIATGIRPSAVDVNWTPSSDNVETTGYEVYRDGKYIRSVAEPRFVDTGLMPDTRYVYQVTARDAAGNYSDRSLPSEALTLVGWQQLYQAEAAMVVGAKIVGGYVDYINATGDYIEWSVNAPFADTYNLLFRYALLSGNRPLEIQINGIVVASWLGFPGTGGWSTYETVNFYAPLNAGLNSIRATTVGANGSNLDHLVVTSGGDPAGSVDTESPSMPTNFSATSGGVGEAALGWGQSTDNVGVTGYDIIRDGVVVATNLQVYAYNDQGLDFARTYVYAVRARDTAGNLSVPSASMALRPHGIWDMLPPKVPAGLAVTAISMTSIQISWNWALDDMLDGVAGYEIYRNGVKVMFLPEPNRPENVPEPKPTWTDTGRLPMTIYAYAVQTIDKTNKVSGLSAPVMATTPAVSDITPPSVPQILTASEVTSSSVVLNWTASTDDGAVVNYDVLRDGSVVATVTTASFTNTGLISTATYVYMVVARDAAGNVSEASSPLSVTLPALASPEPPVSVNFQPARATAPVPGHPTYWIDAGLVYGARTFPGGTETKNFGWNVDHSSYTRTRTGNTDVRLNTICHFHAGGKWEMEVSNGSFDVQVSVGDPDYASTNTINVEGVSYWRTLALAKNAFANTINRVTVLDGKLTIDQETAGDMKTRINYVVITPVPVVLGGQDGVVTKKIWRIMCAGDSITQGIAYHNSYRKVLIDLLAVAGFRFDMVGLRTAAQGTGYHDLFLNSDVQHEGYGGRRTNELHQQLNYDFQHHSTLRPDIVLLHIGSNDPAGRVEDTANNYVYDAVQSANNVGNIIDTIRLYKPDTIIFLAQIIPRRDVDMSEYNTQLLRIADEKNTIQSPVFIVDQFTGFDASTDLEIDDNYHPTVTSGEPKMAQVWFNALQPILNNSPINDSLVDSEKHIARW